MTLFGVQIDLDKLWGSFLLALVVVALTYFWIHHNDDSTTN